MQSTSLSPYEIRAEPHRGSWKATGLTSFHSTIPEVGGNIEGFGGMAPTPGSSKAALRLHPTQSTHKCDRRTTRQIQHVKGAGKMQETFKIDGCSGPAMHFLD